MSVFAEDQSDNVNPLEVLVGEGKKFRSVEDLAKGKMESDRFIEQLQSELKELRTEVESRMSVEEALRKVKEKSVEVTSENTTQERQDVANELDIEALVETKFQNLTQQQKVQSNLSQCDRMMSEKFGDRAREEMARIARDKGISLEFVKATAEQSPAAFRALMGLDAATARTPQVVAAGNVNTNAFRSGGNELERRLNELKELRKTDRRKYYSPRVQQEVYKIQEQLLKG